MKLRKFIRAEKYYFQMLNDDGGVILESQAYQTKDARDAGIESVKNNIGNPDRYGRLTEGGKQYFILKAGNNQEIGRSIGYTDENVLEAAMAYAQKSRPSSKKKTDSPAPAQPDGGEAYGTDGKDDDYKPLSFYETNGSNVASGFDSFSAEGESYFSYSLDSMVYMISEGYKSDASRDNGIASVERNMGNEARYSRQVHPNGKHFFNLKAGNNQEIATSRWFDSEGDMNTIIARLTGGGGAGAVGGTGNLVAANRIASVSVGAAPEPTGEPATKKKRKKRKTEKKPKAEKVYISEGNYHFNDVTYQLFRSGNNKHYFTFKNAEGKTILLNSDVRGFETPDQGEAKIAQVLKYGPTESNYEGKTTKNGKYYFYLKGDEGKNIAKSFFFNTQEDMQIAIGSLLGTAEQVAAAAPVETPQPLAATPEPVKSEKKADDYLACREYEAHLSDVSAAHEDFITFQHDGEHYFAWVAEGKIVMRSEGYTSESARDNGIASVIKNREIEERFSVEEKVGHFFAVLKAGNHQEIARSCPHKSRDGATYWFPSSVQGRAEAAAAAAQAAVPAATPEPVKSEKKADDYLACREYEAHLSDVSAAHEDFITFQHDGEHYFAWVAEGKIVMRSEGYTSESARDNGIASVIKNRELNERFSIDEKVGYFFTVLKAGNHQEIARSCPHKERTGAMYWFPSEVNRRAAEEAAAAKAAEEAAAAKAAEEAAAAKAAEEAAAAKKAEEEAAAAAAAAAVAAKAAKKDDDYLHCKYYKGHARSAEHSDFSLFEEDGEFYFAMLDSDDEVVLRSEGYKSQKGRDNGIASVIKNREIEGRYSTDQKGGMYYVVLKAGNNQEIGRSCPYKEESKALGFLAPAAAIATAAVVVPEPEPDPVPEPPKDKEDDYLSCKEYEGRKVNDKKNNVALFKHEGDGQFYFALYDNNGDVLLRSEGFRTAQERDEELSGVLKYHDNKDMYKRKEKGIYYMDILYDKTGREVGRSCLKKKGAVAAPVAAAAVATAAAVVAPKPAPKPKPKKVVAAPVKEKVAAAPVATSSGGGFKWWWLLPLLLIPLLWFLLRGCGTDVPPPPPPAKVETPAPAPKPEPVPEPVKAETPKPAPAPAPKPVVTGCNCGEKDNPIFNIPNTEAKSVARLGTYPEFGNSHALSPSEFYQKLSNRYSSNEVDRQYLDYVFKSMGYRGGFSDAKASMFSNVELKRGQKGLLGLGEQHHYEYSALNTNDYDRQAFHIQSANGCDVHFMKTCGNYMFFCD